MIKESESFLVWYTGECVIRIFSFQVNDQFSEFMIFAELIDRIRQSLPANYGRKISMSFAVPVEHYELLAITKKH